MFAHYSGIHDQSKKLARILFRLQRDFEKSESAWKKKQDTDPPVEGDKPSIRPVDETILEAINQIEWTWLDLDCLYVFAGILLDHWAMFVFFLSGDKKAEEVTFNVLARKFTSEQMQLEEPVKTIVTTLRKELVWLSVHLTLVRTELIVHPKGPFARIHLGAPDDKYSVGMMSFAKFTEKEILTITDIASRNAKVIGSNWEISTVIHSLVASIGEFPLRADRERIVTLAQRHGYQGADYSEFVSRIFGLLHTSLELLENTFDGYKDKVCVGIRS